MADAEVIRLEAGAKGRRAQARARCRATTATGRPCRKIAVEGAGYCHAHLPQEPAAAPREPRDAVENAMEFVRRRMRGEYAVDDFGYDRELSRTVLMPLMRPLYERYFRVRTLGIDRIPESGAAMVVANHSGTVALDAVVLQYAIASEHPAGRPLRNVGANLVFRLPFIGPMARKTGNVVACDEDAFELIRRDELVGVFPEGYKGVGKGWRERYRLQRFGRGGFIEVALRARVPIVPVAIVGAEEAYPMIGRSGALAKLLGLPYFPITPTFPLLGPLGLLPLPSKWVIEVGDPIDLSDYPPDAADDKMLVFDLSDSIRDRIQEMIYRNLRLRGGAF